MKTPVLAFVSDAIYPYHKGGKEVRFFQISKRLAEQGFDVHVYTMKWWQGRNTIIDKGVCLHGISPFFPLYSGRRRSIKQGILFGIFCLKLFGEKFDVIDVDHMPFFPLYSIRVVCWIRRKKMIATWNEVWGKSYWQEYLKGVSGRIAWLIEKFSVSLPDRIVSISPHTTRRLIDILSVNPKRIVTIPCGFDEEAISASTSSNNKKSDLIFVGRLLSHKHVDTLIKAVSIIKKTNSKIVCRIIGSGPEGKKLRNLQQKLGLEKNIIFHGEVAEDKEVFSLMKSSSVFVLPSTREGFGIVVLEANACGLPVITINHPENAASQLAQVSVDLDENALAVQIVELIGKMKNKKILSSVKSNTQHYPWEEIIKLNKKVYEI